MLEKRFLKFKLMIGLENVYELESFKCVEVCFVCHTHIYFACSEQFFGLQRRNLF